MRLSNCIVLAVSLMLTAGTALADNLVTAVLPTSRSAVFGHGVTVFATVINASGRSLTGCEITAGNDGTDVVTVNYQQTDPATNAIVGVPDALFDLAVGASQSLVLTLSSLDTMDGVEVRPVASCVDPVAGEDVSTPIDGLNTILFSANAQPTPDVIALVATISGDGVVRIQGNGSNAFAVAVANVGIGDTITASVDTGDIAQPLTASICQTGADGQCLAAPALTTSLTLPANGTASFGVFVYANGELPFDPSDARIFVQFADSNQKIRGATSVAVTNAPVFSTALPKGGIFLGGSKTSSGTQGYLSGTDVLFLAEDGEAQGLDEQGNELSGNLTVAASLGLTGTTLYQQANGYDFSIYDWAGTIAQRAWFAAELVSRGNSLSPFGPPTFSVAGNYQADPYERGSSLANLAGAWNIRDPSSGDVIGTASFAKSGSYTGSVSGCSFKGQVGLIDARYDLYRIGINFQGCRPDNGVLSDIAGLAALIDDRTTNDSLILIGNNATFGNGFAISFVRY